MYLVTLWFDQIFYAAIDKDSLRTSDVVLALSAILSVLLFRRLALKVVFSPPALWCIGLFASLAFSTLLAEHTLLLRPTLRLGLQFGSLVFFAIVVASDTRWFGRFVYGGAVVVVLVAAIGFVISLGLDMEPAKWASYRPAFLVRDQHPLLGNWPRPVGGFSTAAEKFGFWAMVASAVIVAGSLSMRRRHQLVMVIAVVISIATLSISASGGLLFIPVWLRYNGYRKSSLWTAAALVLALGVAQLPVHVTSLPNELQGVSASIDCHDHYPNHLARSVSSDGESCHLLPAWNDKVLTRYGLAKKHAYEVWRSHPLLGGGQASFRREAKTAVDGAGNPLLWTYGSPHSALAGTAAEQGLLGLLLSAAFIVALVRALRTVDDRWKHHVLALSFALVGFAAAAVSQDAHRERLFWATAGCVIGLALRARTDERGA